VVEALVAYCTLVWCVFIVFVAIPWVVISPASAFVTFWPVAVEYVVSPEVHSP